MINNQEILNKSAFTEIPHDIYTVQATHSQVQNWLKQTDFNQAIQYYNLNKHPNFCNLFRAFKEHFDSSPELQATAYILNQYLFSHDKYNWTHDLKRSITDPLPALILLSGYQTHQQNMQNRQFDKYQHDKHRFRISETCTRGLDVYNINGSEISQLIWGSFFINAHIVEFSRLQFEIFKYDYPIPKFKPQHKFCINIHIPRGNKLSDESVTKSLDYAKKLIPQYFPEAPAEPHFFIDSWLMDKKLEPYLPNDSNIRLFRKRFETLHSLLESSLPKFLFNTTSSDISQYPADTQLRRRIKKALQDGEKFHDGIALLKPQHTK